MERIILVGLSGTGKSSTAQLLAGRLGYVAIDTDEEIVKLLGRPIHEIFALYGERVFRAAEQDVLRRACSQPSAVIATGGGVVIDEANWTLMRPDSVVVHLTARPSEIVQRLSEHVRRDASQSRPLLESERPIERLEAMWNERREFYGRADVEIDTSGKSSEEIVEAILDAVELRRSSGLVATTSLTGASGRSDIYVTLGGINHLGTLASQRWSEARRVWLITDDNVGPVWGPSVEASLSSVDFAVESFSVPSGESSKSLEQTSKLLDWLIGGRVDRRDIVVALGGGVVGDLGGFAAAIALRGLGLIQVPTSLLAMVDSSVGGKTGINHHLGKNLIGSFYQPQLVVADPQVLRTLPQREVRSGWAEIIKHAMIECSTTDAETPQLLTLLESIDLSSSGEDPELLERIVQLNVLQKATVVRADEREAGLRRLLNYGHTLGHAMEAAGYQYLHGEAVALGLRAAARLSARVGRCPAELVERQDALLDSIGLPARFSGEIDVVMDRITRDKKAVHGALTWILPTAPGIVEVRRDVPLDQVREVAMEIGAT